MKRKHKTCDTCLELERCDKGAKLKRACKFYIEDPFRLSPGEAKWTFLTRKPPRN